MTRGPWLVDYLLLPCSASLGPLYGSVPIGANGYTILVRRRIAIHRSVGSDEWTGLHFGLLDFSLHGVLT